MIRRVFKGLDSKSPEVPTPVKPAVPTWEERIIKCLAHEDKWDYGSLSKTGELFTISSLSVVNVPKAVISKMVQDKQIMLGEDDFYSLM